MHFGAGIIWDLLHLAHGTTEDASQQEPVLMGLAVQNISQEKPNIPFSPYCHVAFHTYRGTHNMTTPAKEL